MTATQTIAIASVFALGAGSTFAQKAKHEVIGSLNGAPLTVRTIREESITSVFIMDHARLPNAASARDEAELSKVREAADCRRVRGALMVAAGLEEMKRFGISVTDEEAIQAGREYLKRIDPAVEVKRMRDQATLLAKALSEVYDKGANPDKVYRDLLSGGSFGKGLWALDLYLGRTPEGRARITRDRFLTTEAFIKGVLQPEFSRSQLLEERLNAIIDREAGANDPAYMKYRDEMDIKPGEKRSVPLDHANYVNQKRDTWWKARRAEMTVVLNDPSLASRCSLDSLGFTVAGAGH